MYECVCLCVCERARACVCEKGDGGRGGGLTREHVIDHFCCHEVCVRAPLRYNLLPICGFMIDCYGPILSQHFA